MTLFPYVALFVGIAVTSVAAFTWASVQYTPRGYDSSWVIGRASYLVYGAAAAALAYVFGLNPVAGFVIGVVGGFGGLIGAFVYAMCTSKNGVK